MAKKDLDKALQSLTEFSDREKRLIKNSVVYAENDPAGLPGHNLMIIIAKLMKELGN